METFRHNAVATRAVTIKCNSGLKSSGRCWQSVDFLFIQYIRLCFTTLTQVNNLSTKQNNEQLIIAIEHKTPKKRLKQFSHGIKLVKSNRVFVVLSQSNLSFQCNHILVAATSCIWISDSALTWNWQQQRWKRQTSKTMVFGVSCAAGCHRSSSLKPTVPPPPYHALSITLKVHSLPVSCTPRSCLRFLTQCQETDIMRPTRDCWAAPLALADSRFYIYLYI